MTEIGHARSAETLAEQHRRVQRLVGGGGGDDLAAAAPVDDVRIVRVDASGATLDQLRLGGSIARSVDWLLVAVACVAMVGAVYALYVRWRRDTRIQTPTQVPIERRRLREATREQQ